MNSGARFENMHFNRLHFEQTRWSIKSIPLAQDLKASVPRTHEPFSSGVLRIMVAVSPQKRTQRDKSELYNTRASPAQTSKFIVAILAHIENEADALGVDLSRTGRYMSHGLRSLKQMLSKTWREGGSRAQSINPDRSFYLFE